MIVSKLPYVALLAGIIQLAGIAVADQIQDDLLAAKKKHEQNVAAAKGILGKAFLARIKDAAQKEDLGSIKALIAEKEAFEADETLPTHPWLTEDVIRYIGSRRSSASATYLVYQNSIQSYAAKNQMDAAKKLELESKQFTEGESAAISLSKQPKAKIDATEADKISEDKANTATRDRMSEFFTEYAKMVQDVNDEPTTVKQEEVLRSLTKKLDDKLKTESWEFHCRINDIQPAGGGRFNISHSLPEEYPSPEDRWTGRTSATVSLTQQQALTLKPGDFIVYTGNPRFNTESDGTIFFSHETYHLAGRYSITHLVHLTNAKTKFQKDADAKNDEKPTQGAVGKKSGK